MAKKGYRRLSVLLVLVLAFMTVLAGCGGGNDQGTRNGTTNEGTANQGAGEPTATGDEQVLHLMISDEPPALDAQLTTDTISINLLNAVQEGLVRLGPNGIEPGIAESWEELDGGTKYIFHLRKDAKWSNGEPVVAQQFLDGWERAANAENASQYANMITDHIKGADAYYKYTLYQVAKKLYDTDRKTYEETYKKDDGTVPTPDVVAYGEPKTDIQPVTWDDVAAKAPDDYTLEVELNQATPYWLELTQFPTYLPFVKSFYEQNKDKYATEPDKLLYNGPFVIESWQHDANVTLVKNPNYWDKDSVKLEKITFDVVKDQNTAVNLYESGEVDRTGLAREQVPLYKDDPNFHTFPELVVFYLEFNNKKKPFDNPKVRKALSMALDRQSYVDTILNNGSEPAFGLVPNGFKIYSGATEDFRDLSAQLFGGPLFKDNQPEEAKKLLEEGLKESGIDPAKFTPVLLGDDTDTARKGNEFLKSMWEKNLGITVKLDQVPFKERLQRMRNHDFEMVFAGWGPDFNDPDTFMFLFETGGAYNDGLYSNKKYDDLVAQARKTTDLNERAKLFAEAEKVLVGDDMGIAPMYYRNQAFLQQPYVKGLLQKNFGSDFEYKWAYIEGKNK